MAGGGETLDDGERRFFGMARLADADEGVLCEGGGMRETPGAGLAPAALETGDFVAVANFAGAAALGLEADVDFRPGFADAEGGGRGEAEPLAATAGVLAREVDADVAGTEVFFGASFFAFPNQSLNSFANAPSRTLP